MLAPLYLGALLVAGGMFALREGATGALGQQRDALKDMLDKHRLERVIEDVSLRDLAGNIAVLEEFRPGASRIDGLQVAGLRGNSLFFISADRAFYDHHPSGKPGWRLENGHLRETTGDTAKSRELPWLELVDFTPADVLLAKKGDVLPMELSFGELEHLASRNQPTSVPDALSVPPDLPALQPRDAPDHAAVPARARAWQEPRRPRGREPRLHRLLLGQLIFRSLGMEGALSPLWSSWAPILLFGSAGAALSESART